MIQWGQWEPFDHSDHNPASFQFMELMEIGFPGTVVKRKAFTRTGHCPSCERQTEKSVTFMEQFRGNGVYWGTWYEKCRICGTGWKVGCRDDHS